MAASESGSPDSYSSFLVTIRLSRLVSEIFACDRHTDGRSDNAGHNIAGHQTVAGQLISEHGAALVYKGCLCRGKNTATRCNIVSYVS